MVGDSDTLQCPFYSRPAGRYPPGVLIYINEYSGLRLLLCTDENNNNEQQQCVQ
jgi:hypothetical protein